MFKGKLVILTDKGGVGYMGIDAKNYDALLKTALYHVTNFHRDQVLDVIKLEHVIRDSTGNPKTFECLNLTDDIKLLLEIAL